MCGRDWSSDVCSSDLAYAEMFAAMILAIIPILVVFIIFQKKIMENTVAGGIKG
jgi:ABC-type glycerol-3-phosphate transport system permease component